MWPSGGLGRAVAAVYVIAWAGLVTGLVWTLYNQATPGADLATPGVVVFVVANVVIWALAVGMRHRVPPGRAAGPFRMSGYGRAWHRLTLGIELPNAIRLIRTAGTDSGGEN